MFHGANNFYFENKNYLSSSIGGILSILLLVIFIVLFIVLGEEFFKGTNGKTSTFRQEKLDFNLTISSYLRVPKSQINAYSFKRLSSQETHFLPKLTHCSSSEAKRFYSDIESLKIGEAKNTIDLEQLLKNSSKSYLTLKDYESYDHYCLNIPLNDTFTIVFTSCHPYYNPNFYDPNRIDEYIDSKCTRNNTDLTFNWRFLYGELTDDGDMNEKIIEYTEKNNTKFNIFTYYVSSYMIKEDNGILFENIKTNYFSKLSSPVGTGEYKPIYPYDLGFSFKIDQFTTTTLKSHVKLQELLAKVFGFISIAYFAFSAISLFHKKINLIRNSLPYFILYCIENNYDEKLLNFRSRDYIKSIFSAKNNMSTDYIKVNIKDIKIKELSFFKIVKSYTFFKIFFIFQSDKDTEITIDLVEDIVYFLSFEHYVENNLPTIQDYIESVDFKQSLDKTGKSLDNNKSVNVKNDNKLFTHNKDLVEISKTNPIIYKNYSPEEQKDLQNDLKMNISNINLNNNINNSNCNFISQKLNSFTQLFDNKQNRRNVIQKMNFFFDSPVSFYSLSNNNKISKLHSFLILIYLIAAVLIFYFFGNDFWRRNSPEFYINEFSNPDVENNQYNMPIMITLSSNLLKVEKLVTYDYSTAKYLDFDYHICSDNEMIYFKNSTSRLSNLTYICTDINKIYPQGDFSQSQKMVMTALCSKLPDSKIDNEFCKNNNLSKNELIYFEMHSKYLYFNSTDLKYNLTDYILKKEQKYGDAGGWHVIKALNQKVSIDENRVYSSPQVMVNTTILPDLSYQEYWGWHTYNIWFEVLSYTPSYTVIHMSLQNMIINSLSILNILYYVLKGVYLIFDKYIYVNSIIDEISERKKKSNKTSKESVFQLNKFKLSEFLATNSDSKFKLVYDMLAFENILTESIIKNKSKNMLENSLQASKVYDNVLSNNENSSKFNLLHAIDITPKLNFHQLNGYTRPSTLGGILSVLVLLSIIPSIIIFGYDFYNKSNPLIVVKKLDLTIDQLKENYWSKVNIPFSFVYSKNYELSNEGPNFKILKDAEFNIPYKCSNDEIMYYYNTQPQSGLNYYCSAVTLNSTHITEDYKLELKRFNLKNSSFTNNEKELYIVGSSAKFKKLNYSRTEDYLNEITISKTESDIKIGKVLRSSYYYTLVNFYDDQNSIIPKYNRTTFENYVNVLYNKDQDEFAFNARDIQVFNIYRTYRKLPEVLAVIIALVANLKIFLGIIHNTIQSYEHLKHLSKLYSKDNSDYDYVDKVVKFRYFLLNFVCPFSFTNNMIEYKKFTSKVMMAFSVSTQISIWNKTLFKPENDIAAQIIQVNNKLDNSHVELVNRIEFKLKNSDLQV